MKPGSPDAETVAIEALAFVAGDDTLLPRFLTLTGIEPGDIRAAAAEPAFLVAVLDFLGGHEPDLVAFCEASGHDPEAVIRSRHTLAGADTAGYD